MWSFTLLVVLPTRFVWVEKRTKYPALDLSLFRVRVFTAGNVASFLNSLAFNSLPFVVTLYLQLVRHVDPLTTGLMFVPMEAVVMVVGPLGGRLSDRYSARGLSSIALLLNAIAVFWFSTFEQNTSFTAEKKS
jgi:nitrate/nitrite transporter NarK